MQKQGPHKSPDFRLKPGAFFLHILKAKQSGQSPCIRSIAQVKAQHQAQQSCAIRRPIGTLGANWKFDGDTMCHHYFHSGCQSHVLGIRTAPELVVGISPNDAKGFFNSQSVSLLHENGWFWITYGEADMAIHLFIFICISKSLDLWLPRNRDNGSSRMQNPFSISYIGIWVMGLVKNLLEG